MKARFAGVPPDHRALVRNGADSRNRTDLTRVALSGPATRPYPRGAPCWTRTNLLAFVAQGPHPEDRAMERATRIELALFLVGSRVPCRLGDARIVKERWHRCLDSNQQSRFWRPACVLRTPARIGLTDRICPGVLLIHNQAPNYSATANIGVARWTYARSHDDVEPRAGIKPASARYKRALTLRSTRRRT